MKFNKIKNRKLSLFAIIAILVVLVLLSRRRPEDYENEDKQSAGPSAIESIAKEKEMTQAELDAVLKFIR